MKKGGRREPNDLASVPPLRGHALAFGATMAKGKGGGLEGFLSRYSHLWPCAVGIACARCGFVVATSGSYLSTDEGVFSDGATAVGLVALLVFAAALFKSRAVLSERVSRRLLIGAVAAVSLALVVMGVMRLTASCEPRTRFALSALIAACSMISVACWLRHARGTGASGAAVLAFSALLISEVPVFATVVLPDGARCIAALPVVLAQLACIPWAHRVQHRDEGASPRFDNYFDYAHRGIADRRFLVVYALGIGAIALVIGFMRGFPVGDPIPFTAPTRIVCFALTELLCVAFLVSAVRGVRRPMTVGIWVVMELLCAVTLLLFATFPQNLEFGAVTITALSSMMSAFVWYVIIAFMTAGRREPLYYAIAVWTVWMGARALGRFGLIAVLPTGGGPSHFAGAFVSLLLLLSTQFVFVKLLDVARFAAEREIACRAEDAAAAGECVAPELDEDSPGARLGEGARLPRAASPGVPASAASAARIKEGASRVEDAYGEGRVGPLEKLFGLDDASTLTDVRSVTMRHNAEEVGRQFLLSNREVEVLAAYALGHTQKRIAEDLCVSESTVRTHIKRIYAKTGMHSRQDILDYMERYTT